MTTLEGCMEDTKNNGKLKTMKCKIFGEVRELYFVKSMYQRFFNTYIGIYSIDGEPWGDLTVNLSDMLYENEAYIDTNNCSKEIIRSLEKRGLIVKTGESRKSGFCTYPKYELTDEFLNEWCIDVM